MVGYAMNSAGSPSKTLCTKEPEERMETVDCELCGGSVNTALFSQYDLAHHVTEDLFTVVRSGASTRSMTGRAGRVF